MGYSKLNIFGISDVGVVRDHQEDAIMLLDNNDCYINQEFGKSFLADEAHTQIVVAIADGMGGAEAGEIASRLAIDGVLHFFDTNLKSPNTQNEKILLEQCIWEANNNIVKFKQGKIGFKNTGTTLVLAWLKQDSLHIAWVGDSRCYLLRNHVLIPLSKDHSLVQNLVDTGVISVEDAHTHPQKNIITQSLGSTSSYANIGYTSLLIEEQDRIILCSDGLNTMLKDNEIESVLKNEINIKKALQSLVQKANQNGGYDNISIIGIDIEESDRKQLLSPVMSYINTSKNDVQSEIPLKTKPKKIGLSFVYALWSIGLIAVLGYFLYSKSKKQEEISAISPLIELSILDTTATSIDSIKISDKKVDSVKKTENIAAPSKSKFEDLEELNTDCKIQVAAYQTSTKAKKELQILKDEYPLFLLNMKAKKDRYIIYVIKSTIPEGELKTSSLFKDSFEIDCK